MEEKVLQILKEKGMRMSNLAAKLGVDQSNLSNKLKNDPKVSLIERIATALDVPVSTFFPDQHLADQAGVLDMGGKRFALVPLPDETKQETKQENRIKRNRKLLNLIVSLQTVGLKTV